MNRVPTGQLNAKLSLPADEEFILLVVVPRELALHTCDADNGVIYLDQIARTPRHVDLIDNRGDRYSAVA
jgi:hypothetical protein